MTTGDGLEWSEVQPRENINGMKILIHIGTDDLRHGCNAKQMYKTWKKSSKTLKRKRLMYGSCNPTYVHHRKKDNKEVIKYNAVLEGTIDHQLITNVGNQQWPWHARTRWIPPPKKKNIHVGKTRCYKYQQQHERKQRENCRSDTN